MLKNKIKSALKSFLIGKGISVYKTLPLGIDAFSDLARLVPTWTPKIIFDIGANMGQSAQVYARRFPRSQIHCFEPVESTFKALRTNVAVFRNVSCHKVALGAKPGDGKVESSEYSEMNRIVSFEDGAHAGEEVIKISTVEDFCRENAIGEISYMKIDTEGSDIEVLRGAGAVLRDAIADVIEVEAGVGVDNSLHVPLAYFRQFLEPYGYEIFGFYEQMHEWTRMRAVLRRTNIVFVSKRLAHFPCKPLWHTESPR